MNRRRMDAEGGRVVRPDRRTGKLAVVVAVQNILVAACLLVTLYVYWDAQKRNSGQNIGPEDDVHIDFYAIAGRNGNGTLDFNSFSSSYKMGLVNKKIYINCTGPYILYMDVCYMSLSDVEAEGTLQVKVEGKDPLVNFTLHALNEVCRGLQSIVYFRVKDEAYLDLYSSNTFKIKNMTMGLSYLLGRRCDF